MNIKLAFSCLNSNCALLGNQYLEVVANALKHICPACGNNLVQKEELAWYKDILDRTDCWNEKAMEFTPSIIAYEYWRLSDLFVNNKIYGALIQLKDVYELTIKFPVLLECSRFYHQPKRTETENTILFNILNKKLSLGDWERLGRMVYKTYGKSKPEIEKILGLTLELYSKTKIVNWRNNTIGHGALGFEEDPDFRSDIEQKLISLAAYFMSVVPLYSNLNLIMKDSRGALLLKGKKAIIDNKFSDADLYIESTGVNHSLYPYIQALQGKVYLFDSLNEWTEFTYFLNYSTGKKHNEIIPELNSLLHHLGKNTNLKILDASIEDIGNSYIELEAIKQFQKGEGIQKNEFLFNWLNKLIQENDRGVFLLQMERGTGKTTFSRSLDNFADDSQRIAGVTSRVHYINDTIGCKLDNFVSQLSDNFRSDKSGKLLISGKTPTIDINHDEPGISMADFLIYFQKRFISLHSTEKLLLIIDGLDEIPNKVEERSIFDFIPNPKLLQKGVYILLTSRTSEELTASLKNRLDKIDLNAKTSVYRSAETNITFLKSYIKNQGYMDAASEVLLKKSEYRILYLNPLCMLLQKNKIQFNKIPEGATLISSYIQAITSSYDEKHSNDLISLLLVISTSFEPLTISEISQILKNSKPLFRDIAYLHDLSSLLNIQRNFRGNVMMVAHDEFRGQIKKLYQATIETLIREFIDRANNIRIKLDPKDLGNVYLLSFLPDYCQEYLGFNFRPEEPKEYIEKIKLVSDNIQLIPETSALARTCKIRLISQVLHNLEQMDDYPAYINYVKGVHQGILNEVLEIRILSGDLLLKKVSEQAKFEYTPNHYPFYQTLASVLYRHQELQSSIGITKNLYYLHKHPDDFLNLILMLKSTDIPIDNKPGMVICSELIEEAIKEGIIDSMPENLQAFLFYSLARIYGDMKEKWIVARKYFEKCRDLFSSHNDMVNLAISEHSLALALFDAGQHQEALDLLIKCRSVFESLDLFDHKYISEPFMLNYQIISFACSGKDPGGLSEQSIYSDEVLQYHLNNQMLICIRLSRMAEAQDYFYKAMVSVNEKGGYYSKAALLNNCFAITNDNTLLHQSKNITEETNYSLGNIIVRFNLKEITDSESFHGFLLNDGIALWPCLKNINILITK